MNVSGTYASPQMLLDPARNTAKLEQGKNDGELRENFDKFVGEAFYGQLLKAMRSTQGKPAYFHGGRAEEIFQQQFDQVLTEEMTKSGAEQFTGPMFELFNAQRT